MLSIQQSIDRREALGLMAAVGLAMTGFSASVSRAAQPQSGKPLNKPRPDAPSPLVGIQIAAHSFYDEGIDHCLDLLKETAGVNAPMVSPYAYYGAMGRPIWAMADHGVPRKDNSKRHLTPVYVRHRDRYYTGISLRHATILPAAEYADKDILADLAEPCAKRGMKLYIRIYEPGGQNALRLLPNWEKVVEQDPSGKPLAKPCLNNPDFRAWIVATVRDLFENYPIAGLQYGAERPGPLGQMLAWATQPGCFCPQCLARMKATGIDAERARKGFVALFDWMQAAKAAPAVPGEGSLVMFLRLLADYPEMLACERQWHLANNEVHQLIYDAVKAIRPTADVGRHVSHIEGSFDIFYRAVAPYAEMASSNDFVKTILYHDIFGPRVIGYMENVRKTVMRDVSLDQFYALFCACAGHDPKAHPPLDKLAQEGFGPEYVYRETRRAVDSLGNAARFYGGIGTDIPRGTGWGTDAWPSDPEKLYRAVRRCFDAGAGGIVISREYEENRVESLRVVGRAVRDASAGKA